MNPSQRLRPLKPQTVCYGDIDLFLLRNPDNPERDVLMAEVDFRNLKKGDQKAQTGKCPVILGHI